MNIEPCILRGRYVRLEPLTLEHLERLANIGLDEDLWRFTTVKIWTYDDMRLYIEAAQRDLDARIAVPFATVDLATGLVVGSTRFTSISREHKRVEIGFTWIASPWQRSFVNTEAKYLMLRHAFEGWGCNRVELKTSVLNEQSQRAMERLGAQREGVLRRHMINQDGTVRDTVYYSFIGEEWPATRVHMHQLLSRRPPSDGQP